MTKTIGLTDHILLSDASPPWVVQLRCGNLRARALREFLESQWSQVLTLLPGHRLVQLYADRIKAVS
ncbi:hypothetical protein [Deinococcus budaensis]|uniref:Putative nuclease of putative toxin-antitoxin system n=1 Tax=Deinococcus budaensis TaxID=1665626 RepID=A0A7W8LP23_9DEIO|nr:hypothetical protein [Deinococcus budaensis]MBB5233182.1 putative nuclease of putative toxin-antitoxin system [Deinococcus budaensis]